MAELKTKNGLLVGEIPDKYQEKKPEPEPVKEAEQTTAKTRKTRAKE